MASPYKVTHLGKDYILGTVSENRIRYNLEYTLRYLDAMGKHIYGPKFKIYRRDLPIINKLIVYSIKDEKMSKKLDLDLNKGILLTGPVGCGKTAMMKIIRFVTCRRSLYEVVSARLVTFEYVKRGHQVITDYSNVKNYCFDDLGLEQYMKHYGNECNVMGEILLSRYDLMISHKVITHATTNLNSDELENYYGNRVRSRMKEMFNLISFGQKSWDKRY